MINARDSNSSARPGACTQSCRSCARTRAGKSLAAAKAHPSPVPYLLAFICNFGFAIVIARMISFTNMRTALGGARIGMMLGFGVAMLPMMTEYFFEMKHLNFALIAAGYPAIGGIVMGTILGAWQKRGAVALASKAAA